MIRPVSSEPDIVMAHGSTGDQTELFFSLRKLEAPQPLQRILLKGKNKSNYKKKEEATKSYKKGLLRRRTAQDKERNKENKA
jgi:hypothetical protein